jgi:hypothetical protein
VAPGVRVAPADERAADRGVVAGGKPVAEVRREAAPDQVVQPDHRLGVDAERRGLGGVEDRAAPVSSVERPEAAAVRDAGRIGRVLEDHLRAIIEASWPRLAENGS